MPPLWPKQPMLDSFRWRPSRSSLPSLLDLPHRVLTHSGRAAIGLALQEIGIQPGEAVLVPTYHCPTMIAPIERLGAVPVFYGLDGNGMPLFPCIPEDSSIRAALVPHLFGIPRPMLQLAKFCRARRIALIEDCAHCFFGASDDAPVGSVGDYAIGSLPKFFPTLEGGILASGRHTIRAELPAQRTLSANVRALWDSLDISARAGGLGRGGVAFRALARWRRKDLFESLSSEEFREPPDPTLVRENALADRLLDPDAIRPVDAWLVGHTDLATSVQYRQRNFNLYAEHFADVPGATSLIATCPKDAAPYVFPLLVERPDESYRQMRDAALPVFRWDRLWPGARVDSADTGFRWARELIQFACHQTLTSADIQQIALSAQRCLSIDSEA